MYSHRSTVIHTLMANQPDHWCLRGGDSVLPVTPVERLRDFNLRALIYRASIHTGPKRLTRDVSLIHRRQVEAGRAVWLGQPWPEGRAPAPPLADLERAVARVRALFPAAPQR